jgi:hypothetical protein
VTGEPAIQVAQVFGTQCACFTGTKVQILTLLLLLLTWRRQLLIILTGAQFRRQLLIILTGAQRAEISSIISTAEDIYNLFQWVFSLKALLTVKSFCTFVSVKHFSSPQKNCTFVPVKQQP